MRQLKDGHIRGFDKRSQTRVRYIPVINMHSKSSLYKTFEAEMLSRPCHPKNKTKTVITINVKTTGYNKKAISEKKWVHEVLPSK